MALPTITRWHLERTRWWALVRFARWLGVRWKGVAPHERWRLEVRIAKAIRSMR